MRVCAKGGWRDFREAGCPLPTAHYPLPATHYSLLTYYSLLHREAGCPLPTTHYPLPATRYPLLTTELLLTTHCFTERLGASRCASAATSSAMLSGDMSMDTASWVVCGLVWGIGLRRLGCGCARRLVTGSCVHLRDDPDGLSAA